MNAEEVKQQFQQAAALFQSQQYQEALQILDQLENAVPNNQDIMYFKARVLGVLNRNQEASALCDRLTALGNPRGEQLKAALNVTPAGPPPVPTAQQSTGDGVPPILPDQDTAQSSYSPPQFAAGRSSNKKMNIIGFGLMGTLLLAALIVVIVRSGGSKEDKATPTPAQQQVAAAPTEAGETPAETAAPADTEESGEASEGETAAPSEETPDAEAAPAQEEASEEGAQAETPATEESGSPKPSAADLASMDPAQMAKTIQEMDTAELAEFLKTQAEAAITLMEQQIKQQGAPAEANQFVTPMRQELANTDFVEEAKNLKKMMAEASPELLAQMNALFAASAGSGAFPGESSPGNTGDLLTNDLMKGFDLEGGIETEAAETESEEAPEQPEAETAPEEPLEPEESAASEEPPEPAEPADTPEKEEPAEKPELEPEKEQKEEPEEEVVEAVFGDEIAKVLEFPEHESIGTLSLRRTGALEREPWEPVGKATGKIGIPPHQDVRLQLEEYHLEPLLELEPDDIQVLSLWNLKVDDKDIEFIKHLKGLKELDIRQTRISPDGWAELQEALPECRILY